MVHHKNKCEVHSGTVLEPMPAAGLRSGEDSWYKKYEDVKELAADILAQIQVDALPYQGCDRFTRSIWCRYTVWRKSSFCSGCNTNLRDCYRNAIQSFQMAAGTALD